MTPILILAIVACYFLVLVSISYLTGRKADNYSFFLGSRKSPWYIVAFGMIGTSLSGVTFISVPGEVGQSQFGYLQVVLGYLVGYIAIATVLMPLYYRLQVTSIYTYLKERFGNSAYKTGAFYFLLSRVIGASFRLYLVASVLQLFVFEKWGVSFEVTVAISIAFIWIYTRKGGIKTIIWTDTLQTFFMLAAVAVAIYTIAHQLDLTLGEAWQAASDRSFTKVFFTDDWFARNHLLKQFFGGAFIAIAMTGLDQDMMQKNLSCKNIGDAQKNMISFSLVLILVNGLFLFLGALLYLYVDVTGIALPEKTDHLFPTLALGGELPIALGVFFILGLVAAAYSSADSALTALTTSVCIDFMQADRKPAAQREKLRKYVHVGMSALLLLVIIVFNRLSNTSVIDELLTVAAYTYGPLLGLYAFGIFTKYALRDRYIPVVCLLSPLLTYWINKNSQDWFSGYAFGYELLVVNGLITLLGLALIAYFSTQKKMLNVDVNSS